MKQNEKIIPFPSYMKEKLEYFKSSNLDIKYESGKIIIIPLINIEVIVPHIITFKSKEKEFILLYYGDYEENRNRFYSLDLSEEISYTRLKDIVKNL